MYKHAKAFGAAISDDVVLKRPMNYPCPVCGAQVNQRCRGPKGQVVHYHSSRTRGLGKNLGRPRPTK